MSDEDLKWKMRFFERCFLPKCRHTIFVAGCICRIGTHLSLGLRIDEVATHTSRMLFPGWCQHAVESFATFFAINQQFALQDRM